ncbi:MAG: V-type ATP synthase subunit F [Clostridiales bacterium]|nr:V-type ATP synthase subunit F [Clostridiales bacterium]
MKFFLITDNTDAATGMRLAGIENTLISDEAECKEALEKAVQDEHIGIILITQGAYEKYAPIIDEMKKTITMPLITEIPDNGASFKSDAITRYVIEAIGIG